MAKKSNGQTAPTKITSIIFTTFSIRDKGRTATNGMIDAFYSYFVPKAKYFVLMDQPHPGSDSVLPEIEIYQNGKRSRQNPSLITSKLLSPLLKMSNANKTQVTFKIRDFLADLEFILKNKQNYDLFIGLEAINAIAGLLLKKLGRVKQVVYYVSDYSTDRYRPKWFNDLYLSLDRFAASNADYIWDVSKAMMPARIGVGLNPEKAAPLIHVPNGLFPKQIDYISEEKVIPHSLLFVGTLGKINGPDIAIKALEIVKKTYKDAKLHIYGSGEPDLTRLKNLTEKLKLEDSVIFHGFVSDQIQLSRESKQYAIALAPYTETPGSPRWWADATKIRLYMAAGLPTITTKVPPLGKEIEADGAGIITKDNAKSTADAILKLFKDKKLFSEMKQKAIKRARTNTWDNTYSTALKQMSLEL